MAILLLVLIPYNKVTTTGSHLVVKAIKSMVADHCDEVVLVVYTAPFASVEIIIIFSFFVNFITIDNIVLFFSNFVNLFHFHTIIIWFI